MTKFLQNEHSRKFWEADIPKPDKIWRAPYRDEIQPSPHPYVKIHVHDEVPSSNYTRNKVQEYCRTHKIRIINHYYYRTPDENFIYSTFFVVHLRHEKHATWLQMKWGS